jgi:hypothetical protein
MDRQGMDPRRTQRESNDVAQNDAKTILLSTSTDVLAILDCCYASDVGPVTYKTNHTYELLAACGVGGWTRAPGRNPFVSALAWALKQLVSKDCLNTAELQRKVAEAPDFPGDQHPKLHRRAGLNNSHLTLAGMLNRPLERSMLDRALETIQGRINRIYSNVESPSDFRWLREGKDNSIMYRPLDLEGAGTFHILVKLINHFSIYMLHNGSNQQHKQLP